jgi:putative lysine transport system substrate-binding protein
MLVALESGAVDLVVTDMPTALAATAVYSDMVLLDFTGTEGEFEVSDEEINLGISMKKGNAELLAAVNGVLAELSVEDYEAMMADAIAVQPLSE